MQSILYHNSSGAQAFTGNLKKKEVHHSITMHPVKHHRHMYRINTYLKNIKIQDLKETQISLHRDILTALTQLKLEISNLKFHNIADLVPLFPDSPNLSEYLGDTRILGVSPNLNRYYPKKLKNVLVWDFIAKVIFSTSNSNPKRRMEIFTIESLDDIIRELMEIINAFSKQRGRIIEFKEILYGYQRLDPIHGADYILDILLVYKKYRGRKMTVPVRRHAYLQQSFTGIEIRELPLGESPIKKLSKDEYYSDHVYTNEDSVGSTNNIPFLNFKKLNVPIRDVFQSGLLRISENLPNVFKPFTNKENCDKKKIHFILPLSGRYEIFIRFLKNYEEVCLINDKWTELIVTLYIDNKHPLDFEKTIYAINITNKRYPDNKIIVVKMYNSEFSRGQSLEKGIGVCRNDSLIFLIDVDISFNLESLERIRLNTIEHYKVYFPIVFSKYNPQVINGRYYNIIKMKNTKRRYLQSNNLTIDSNGINLGEDLIVYNIPHSDNHGYYRQSGFGIMSVYKSDFISIGGFKRDIKGWGLEDVNLFDKFVQSNISVFRTVDPGLIHIFHSVDCDKNLDINQYNMCVGTRVSTFGSVKHMIIHILNNPELLFRLKINTISETLKNVP